ncbi:hypothetical protein DKX38_026124 [Salix brachista]|uniref:Uncharacterized protein n=1 Tax=Salix brachista TaxID=2182728 RepID=A0A5N5JWQ6_9ROSI|nr:hypothetical protein DKX38_026124 [Salix brachista]
MRGQGINCSLVHLYLPCLVAFEVGFHTELKASSFCSSLSNQYQCFLHIFSQTKTGGKWLSKVLVDPLYLR